MKIDEHGNYTDYTATIPSCGSFHQEYDDSSVDLGHFPMVFRRKTPKWNGQDLPYFASKVQLLGSMAGRLQTMCSPVCRYIPCNPIVPILQIFYDDPIPKLFGLKVPMSHVLCT